MSNPYAPPDDRPSRPATPDDGAPAQGQQPQGQPGQGQPAQGQPAQGQPGQGYPPQGPYPPAPYPQGPGVPGPGAGWGMPPGQLPTAPPSRDTPPPDPEKVAAVARHTRTLAALLLAAVVTSTFPVPWQAAGLVFTLLALVVGARALTLAIRSRVRGSLTGILVGGIGVAAFWLAISGSMALMWPVYLERQECLAGALTISAKHECEAQFQDALKVWVEQRTGR